MTLLRMLLCLLPCYFLFLSLSGNALYSSEAEATEAAAAEIEKHDEDLPLDPERVISFTTNEGTWMSMDVSPDGKTIVFDLMGDLYRLPMKGGKASRLTQGMAFDTRPRFSPDGGSILFTSDRDGAENLWILDLETEETTQVTTGDNQNYPSAAWTPDGEYIVAAKGRRHVKLWLFHKEGGSGVQLTQGADNWKTLDPAVSPDGRYIYYSHRTGAWQYNARLPQYQLGVYDREDGETQSITSRYGSAFAPVLSPDGNWMVYGTRYEAETGLILRNIETGDERWLAYPVQRDEQESVASMGVMPGMAFTPDSRAVVASFGGKIHRVSIDGNGAEEIPFEADVEVYMGPRLEFTYPVSDEKRVVASQIRDAAPSPDGKQLAFTALNRLYVMDLPYGIPRRLTRLDATEAMPTWSPDGRWLAFVTWNSEGGHLYRINPNAETPQLERLTGQAAVYTEPAWSYNSDRIVMLRGAVRAFEEATGPRAFGAAEDIVSIPSEGGDIRLIAKAYNRYNPHFIKKNDRIYLNHRSRGLISIRWDGTDEREHVKITGITTFGQMSSDASRDGHGHDFVSSSLMPDPRLMTDSQAPSDPALIRKAPEGEQVLALINNDVYVVTLPYVGEAPTISVSNPEAAAFPAQKLTEIGGQFPSWSDDGRAVNWSIGNAYVTYDLEDAKAFAQRVEAKREAEEEEETESESGDNGEGNDDVEEDANGEENGEDEDEEERFRPNEVRVEVEFERDIPAGSIVLRNANIISMNGEQVIERGDILVENNRITAVGEAGGIDLDLPEDVVVKDMTGMTIVPGFIDTHAHMRPSWGLHKQDAWTYEVNLAYGVTTTRDPQTGTTDVLTYADLVEAGEIIGPRIYSTGPGLGFWSYNIRDLDHARDVMRQYSQYYNTKTIKMYLAGNRKQRQWILEAAKEQQIMPTTEGALNWKLNMTQLIDGYPGHEHSFPIYPIYGDVIRTVSESKMAYTPTLLVAYGGPWAEEWFYATENPYADTKLRRFTPYTELASKTRRRSAWFMEDEHIFQRHAEFVKNLVENDGIAGVGSHGQLQGVSYHWELWAMQSGGLSEHHALKVATIDGAKAIGLDGDLGSIERGKLADLIILERNPLEDIRNTNTIRYVMKNGRLYEGDTLNEVYPRQREAYKDRWVDEPEIGLPGLSK